MAYGGRSWFFVVQNKRQHAVLYSRLTIELVKNAKSRVESPRIRPRGTPSVTPYVHARATVVRSSSARRVFVSAGSRLRGPKTPKTFSSHKIMDVRNRAAAAAAVATFFSRLMIIIIYRRRRSVPFPRTVTTTRDAAENSKNNEI